MDRPLAGLGVLVTRPSHQSDPLCTLLAEQGAIPFSFPVLALAPPEDTTPLPALFADLATFDRVIFVSPNAVQYAADWIKTVGGWPPGVTATPMGAGTARALVQRGIPIDLMPSGRFDSESLLASLTFSDLRGQRVLIVRGEGGREWLAEELIRRGASVVYAAVYRRTQPTTDPAALLCRLAEIHVAVITSSEGLHNLCALLGGEGQAWLQDTEIVLFSHRTAEQARSLGLRGVIHVTTQATDVAIVDVLLQTRGRS